MDFESFAFLLGRVAFQAMSKQMQTLKWTIVRLNWSLPLCYRVQLVRSLLAESNNELLNPAKAPAVSNILHHLLKAACLLIGRSLDSQANEFLAK